MTKDTDTKRRMLDTATVLMGRHGITNVSIRQILGEAGINLALCQYHYGGRDGLVEAVLKRPAQVLTQQWEDSLFECEGVGCEKVAPREVLGALFGPVIRLCRESPDGANLLGQLLANPDPFFRQLGESMFHEVLSRFGRCLKIELAGRFPDRELSARIELLESFVFFALSRSGARILLSDGDIFQIRERTSLEEMVSFCMAGLGGATTRNQEPPKALA